MGPLIRGLTAALAVFCSLPAVGAVPGEHFAVEVRPGNWGAARTQDIEAVLQSVGDVLVRHFPTHASDRIVVERGTDGPRVLAEKTSSGAYQVYLDVIDTRWDQFAYQFGHELCHVFTNFEHREIDALTGTRDHQWLEEAVCEAVSLRTLDLMADSWERAAPYPAWTAYAPVFRMYSARLLAQAQRGSPAQASLAAWYRDNRAELERNPYARTRARTMVGLIVTLLRQTPGALEALGYLNLGVPASSLSLRAYLECWSDACPEEYRPFIARLVSAMQAPDGA